MTDKTDKWEFINTIIWILVGVIGFVWTGLGCGEMVSNLLISFDIEWISVTAAGNMVSGIITMITAAVGNFATGRAIGGYKNLEEVPEE